MVIARLIRWFRLWRFEREVNRRLWRTSVGNCAAHVSTLYGFVGADEMRAKAIADAAKAAGIR